jgi:hypothetical protein
MEESYWSKLSRACYALDQCLVWAALTPSSQFILPIWLIYFAEENNRPVVNLPCYQKSAYSAGMKIFTAYRQISKFLGIKRRNLK